MEKFEKGDVIEFCDEQYFVLENHGSSGVVATVGIPHDYSRMFYWNYQGEECKFIRKSEEWEMKQMEELRLT